MVKILASLFLSLFLISCSANKAVSTNVEKPVENEQKYVDNSPIKPGDLGVVWAFCIDGPGVLDAIKDNFPNNYDVLMSGEYPCIDLSLYGGDRISVTFIEKIYTLFGVSPNGDVMLLDVWEVMDGQGKRALTWIQAKGQEA